ncbi:MAG: DNA-binding response OmpR family regulator [Verrucomicrobiales bacterium]|jgi:DNA-binding response OmpR family regulator
MSQTSPDTKSPRKVLIIDDDEEFAESLTMSLGRGSDFEVAYETCSGRARATAREFQPDLILLDVMLNKISGSDLYFLFQRDADLKNTPVIVLSALIEEESAGGKEVAYGIGLLRRLPAFPKPFRLSGLIEAVNREIDKAEEAAQVSRPTPSGRISGDQTTVAVA